MFTDIINALNDPNGQILLALNFALIMQLLGALLAVAIDPYMKRDNRRRIFLIVMIIFVLLIEPQVSNTYGDTLYRNHLAFWNTLLSSVSYILRSVALYLFIKLTGSTRWDKVLNYIILINAIICLTPFFVPWVFSFDAGGHWHRGPLGFVPFLTCLILIVWLIADSFTKYKGIRRRESIVPVVIAAFVAFAVYLDTPLGFSPDISFLTVAMTGSTVFFYIWLHLQFVREHENAIRAEQRIKIMMSQIQPHFLFNALSTIQALTETDPERASKVIEEFAIYLRQNIDSLNQDDLIPVKKELEHTKVYSDIEQVRFPSIRIDYDIEDENFLIPPLTIQPMVENAIRHGVRGKKNGWVSVSTYKEEGYHVISINDNGKGFDYDEAYRKAQNGGHIGLQNVRDRIIDMTGGSFSIESEMGEGTCIIIKIPE
ncbi:sensor histidine kinase [Butyrivibrio fibrisolvens]|uniref:sensor histidine kinase n=1 Tax=Butyrivibrio fibrisolvens TaxID=831 RepID=UPI0003B709BA|nr:histidine kinase [Butyrivibrio fibrisolvens]